MRCTVQEKWQFSMFGFRPVARPADARFFVPSALRLICFFGRAVAAEEESGTENGLRSAALHPLWGSCLRHRARNAEAVTVWLLRTYSISTVWELWAAEVAPAPPASLNSNAIAQYQSILGFGLSPREGLHTSTNHMHSQFCGGRLFATSAMHFDY